MAKKQKQIKWKNVEVLVSKIKPTPNNFKLKTEEGAARFKTSVDSYGLAGSVILNTDYTLIDGNTRWEQAKEMGHKKIWASMPDRKLTAREFLEFSAMYDMARAGEVDLLRIKEEVGTTKTFFEKWGIAMPDAALDKLADMEKADKVVNPTTSRKIDDKAREVETRNVTLLFTVAESEEFIRLAESLYAKFKVDNITDLAMKLVKLAKKSK